MGSDVKDSRPVCDRKDHYSDKRREARPVTKERDQRPSKAPEEVASKVQKEVVEVTTAKPTPTTPKDETAVSQAIAAKEMKQDAAPPRLSAKVDAPKDATHHASQAVAAKETKSAAAPSRRAVKVPAPKNATKQGSTKHAVDSSCRAQSRTQDISTPELQLEGIAIKGQGAKPDVEPRRGPRNAQREAFEARKKELSAMNRGEKRTPEQSDPASSDKVDDQSKRAKLTPKAPKKKEERQKHDAKTTKKVEQTKRDDDDSGSQAARVKEEARTTTATKSPKEAAKIAKAEQEKKEQPKSHEKSDNVKQDEVIDEVEQRKRDIKARIAQRHANRGSRVQAGRYVPPASRELAQDNANSGRNGRAGGGRGGYRSGPY